jgi:hypothetical protein
VEAAHGQIQQLQGDVIQLEGTNSMLRWDLHVRDEEVRLLRWKLANAEVELVRLNVLLESQSKRKH